MEISINGKKVIKLGTIVIPVLKGDTGERGLQGPQGIQGEPRNRWCKWLYSTKGSRLLDCTR